MLRIFRRRDDAPAIIARNEGGTRREISFAQLADQSGDAASALARDGVVIGDRVAGFLPTSPKP